MTRRRGGGVKRRETNLSCDQFPKFSPQPRTHKDIHRVKTRREGGREEIEVTWGIKKKKESYKGESNQASNHTRK